MAIGENMDGSDIVVHFIPPQSQKKFELRMHFCLYIKTNIDVIILLFLILFCILWYLMWSEWLQSSASGLPSRLGDDHFSAELVEFVPQLFGLQAARDFGHLLAGDAGIGGDEGLRAHRGRAPAEVPVPVQGRQVSQSLLVAGGFLHKLFWFYQKCGCVNMKEKWRVTVRIVLILF